MWETPNRFGVSYIKGKLEQMFLGQYRHNLDNKNRLTIPARYRELIAEGAYITRGFDGNLMVFPAATFENISRQANEASVTDQTARLLKRLIFSNADFVEVDKAGRILIPDFLRSATNIHSEIVIAGVGDHFELWPPEGWEAQMNQLADPETNAQRFAALDISGVSQG